LKIDQVLLMSEKPTYQELARRVRELEQKIDDLEQTGKKAADEANKFETLFNNTPWVMLIVDPDRRVVELNEPAVQMTRRMKEASIGMRGGEALRCFHAFDHPEGCGFSDVCQSCIVRNTVIDTFRTGRNHRSVEAPIPYTTEEGSADLWVLISTVLLPSSQGQRVLVCLEDMTQRKSAGEALKRSEFKFRLLAEAVGEVFWMSTPGIGKIVYVSPGYETVWGKAREDLYRTPKSFLEAIHADDLESFRRAIDTYHRKGLPYSSEYRIHTRGGGIRWIHERGYPAPESLDGLQLMCGICSDITQRKLEEKNAKIYEDIISSTPDGIAFLDRSYRYVIVNTAYEKFSGIGREWFIGRTVAQYLGADVFTTHVKPHFDRCLGGETVNFQDWFEYPEMGRRYMDITYFPFRNRDDQVAGLVAITRDITKRRLAIEALEKSYRELDLREKIAKLFLTSPTDQIFSDILALLLDVFESRNGFMGYIDDHGDLICPSMTRNVWGRCNIAGKSIVFPKECWGGIWGESLKTGRALLRNGGLKLPEGHLPLRNALVVPLVANNELIGQIALANKPADFTAEDQQTLESIGEFLAPVMRIFMDKATARQELQLNLKKIEEKNTALNVLLEYRREDKQKLSDSILGNFKKMVFPYYERLRKCRTREDIATILDIVETNTQESLSPLSESVFHHYQEFTPMEIQVADLVKTGKTSKQISEILNISTRSVFFHRNNIRRKLNIKNEKANLRSVLGLHREA
jgi:PAS domain S-box-containing protein